MITEIYKFIDLNDTYVTDEYAKSNMGWAPVLPLYKKKVGNTLYKSRIFIKTDKINKFYGYNLVTKDNKTGKYYLRLYFHKIETYIDNILYNFNIKVKNVLTGIESLGIGITPDFETQGFNFNSEYTTGSFELIKNITTNDIENGFIDLLLSKSDLIGSQGFVITFENETEGSNLEMNKSYGVCFNSVESNFSEKRPCIYCLGEHEYNDLSDKIVSSNIVMHLCDGMSEEFYENNKSKKYRLYSKDAYNTLYFDLTGSLSGSFNDRFRSVHISGSSTFTMDVDKRLVDYYLTIDDNIIYNGKCYVYKNKYYVEKEFLNLYNNELKFDVVYKYGRLTFYTYFKSKDVDNSYIKKRVHQSLIYNDANEEYLSGELRVPNVIFDQVYFKIRKLDSVFKIDGNDFIMHMFRDGKNKNFFSYIDFSELFRKNDTIYIDFYDTRGQLLYSKKIII